MNDTSPAIQRKVRAMLMARTGEERLRMASQMFDTARALALASFPPGLDDTEVRRRLCQRFYGNETDVDGFIRAMRGRNE
jgi:hypothetical protein